MAWVICLQNCISWFCYHLVCGFLLATAQRAEVDWEQAEIEWEVVLQGEAKKAKAAQAEAAKKEIAELMAKAKADMDMADKKSEAKAAQSQADEIQKEVLVFSPLSTDASAGTAEMLGLCTLNSMPLVAPVCRALVMGISHHFCAVRCLYNGHSLCHALKVNNLCFNVK